MRYNGNNPPGETGARPVDSVTKPSTHSSIASPLARRALPLAVALACGLALAGCGRRGAPEAAGTERQVKAAEPGVATPAPQASRSSRRTPITPPRRETYFDFLL